MVRNWSSDTVEIGGVEVGGKEPLVCASVTAGGPDRMLERASGTGADLVELRVDTLDEPGSPAVERAVADMVLEKPVLLTVRREAEEGEFRGGERSRADVICSLMNFVDAVDVELEAPQSTLDRVRQKASEVNIPVVVSFHDFSETSSVEELMNVMERVLEVGDVAKVAVTANSSRDVLDLLDATLEAKKSFEAPLAALAMGDVGSHSRVVAPLYGSDLTYAAADEAVAPGQLSVEETLRGLELLGAR